MDKFAYFNLPDPQEEAAPPPPSMGDFWGDFWRDSMSLLDFYCERSAAGWWQEPLNTWSNLLFLLAAFAAFCVCRRRQATSTAAIQDRTQDRTRLMLCLDLSAVGVASWAFHASGWALFALLDVLAILVFTTRASFALLIRGLRFSSLQAFFGVLAIFALAPLLSFLPLVGDYLPSGGFYFSPILLSPILTLGIVATLMLRHADLRRCAVGQTIAFALLAVSLTLRTLDLPLCAEWQHGTHFLWHTLNALAFFLVIVSLPKKSKPKKSKPKKSKPKRSSPK